MDASHRGVLLNRLADLIQRDRHYLAVSTTSDVVMGLHLSFPFAIFSDYASEHNWWINTF